MLILNFIHIQPEFVIEFQDGEGGGRRLKQGIRYGAHTNCRKSRYPPFTQPDTPFTFLYARLLGAFYISHFLGIPLGLSTYLGAFGGRFTCLIKWDSLMYFSVRFTEWRLIIFLSNEIGQFISFRFFHQYYCYKFSFNNLIFWDLCVIHHWLFFGFSLIIREFNFSHYLSALKFK